MTPLHSCPEPDLLDRFLNGGLDDVRSAEIQSHLAPCGLCSLLAQRLDAFHSIAESPTPAHCGDWDRLQPIIDERFHRRLRDRQSSSSHSRRNFPSWLSSPALAWSFVFLLAYPAWLGLRRPSPGFSSPPPARLQASPAHFLDINVARDGQAAPATTQELRPGTPLLLGFFAAVEPGRSYTVSLANEAGAFVVRDVPVLPNDDKGNFFFYCDSRLLPAGRYTLTLDSAGAVARKSDLRQFEFITR